MEGEFTMATTVDADIHLFEGELSLVRMKVERKRWLVTVDDHFVKCDKVVSLWTPAPEEIKGWSESGN